MPPATPPSPPPRRPAPSPRATATERWIECVPNVSEGRRPEVLAELADVVGRVDGAVLLAREADPDHNRAVFTIAARPQAVLELGERFVDAAIARVDLATHAGVHPRMGAVDVFPLVPLAGVTMAECVTQAGVLARRLAERFGLPVYLYERAARVAERRSLARVRKAGPVVTGGPRVSSFEYLRHHLPTRDALTPDFGPRAVHPTAGAIAVGARPLLIAYNVDLDTRDLPLATAIARRIRTSTGGFPAVRALGLALDAPGCVQVSMNLIDYTTTGLAEVYRAIERTAADAGVAVRRSERIGLIPLDAIARAVRSFEAAGEPVPASVAAAPRGELAWAWLSQRVRLSPALTREHMLDHRLADATGSAGLPIRFIH